MGALQNPRSPFFGNRLGACFVSPSLGGEVGHISMTHRKWKPATWKQWGITPGNHICRSARCWHGRTLHGFSIMNADPEESHIWFNFPQDYHWYQWRTEKIPSEQERQLRNEDSSWNEEHFLTHRVGGDSREARRAYRRPSFDPLRQDTILVDLGATGGLPIGERIAGMPGVQEGTPPNLQLARLPKTRWGRDLTHRRLLYKRFRIFAPLPGTIQYDSKASDSWQGSYEECARQPRRAFDVCCFLPHDTVAHAAFSASINCGMQDVDGQEEHDEWEFVMSRLQGNKKACQAVQQQAHGVRNMNSEALKEDFSHPDTVRPPWRERNAKTKEKLRTCNPVTKTYANAPWCVSQALPRAQTSARFLPHDRATHASIYSGKQAGAWNKKKNA